MPNPREPAEVAVGRTDLRAVLQGKRRKVGIRGEVACGAGSGKQRAQQRPVLFAGPHRFDERLPQPLVDIPQGALDSERPAHDSGMGREAKEGEQNDPGQADARRFGERLLEPVPSLRMTKGLFAASPTSAPQSRRGHGRWRSALVEQTRDRFACQERPVFGRLEKGAYVGRQDLPSD